MPLVELLRDWAKRKEATPGQIALTWLMAQKPWIVPIPGTTKSPHLLENAAATAVSFTAMEFAALNASLAAITIHGLRLPQPVLGFSGVETPLRSQNK
jgi:aryl-alcohol dehydrogenase-like predicted oxidoreductase